MRLMTLVFLLATACSQATYADTTAHSEKYEVVKSEAEWRKTLTKEQFHILREAGTERAFSGKYWNHKEEGTYVCAACQQKLYASKDKFKSGTGWPSYTRAISKKAIRTKTDNKFGMKRTELLCGRCGGHLGHVFNDGPKPTYERHCINSASLLFQPNKDVKTKGAHDKQPASKSAATAPNKSSN